MKRREFISLLGGAAAAWPVVARAQKAIPIIGFLGAATPAAYESRLTPFRQTLKEAGFVEGENVRLEYRWANNRYENLSALAAELVRAQVAVIVAAGGAQTALAAKVATPNIPIVFQNGSDPVKIGLVTSMSRPGGNLTGITILSVETVTKRLELMRELAPSASVLGWMLNPSNPNAETIVKDVNEASRSLARKIIFVNVASLGDFDAAFTTLTQARVGALVVSADPIFPANRDKLVELATRYAIPTMYPFREFVEAGGLASYGDNFNEVYRQVGLYTTRILKGEKPANLPVLQSSKLDFVINLKTAKALGLDFHPQLLARADEVIE
jgi:putative ABC transport system substrate-binding protein